MNDFRKLAQSKRRQFEIQQDDEKKAREQDRLAREMVLQERIAVLEKIARPIISQAESDFALEQIELVSFDDFDVANFVVDRRPSIKVLCKSPARKDDGYQSESPPIFIEADRDEIYIGLGENGFDRRPKAALETAKIGEHEAAFSKAFDFLLERYFEHIKELPWIGG